MWEVSHSQMLKFFNISNLMLHLNVIISSIGSFSTLAMWRAEQQSLSENAKDTINKCIKAIVSTLNMFPDLLLSTFTTATATVNLLECTSLLSHISYITTWILGPSKYVIFFHLGKPSKKKNSKKSDIVTIRSGTYLPYLNSDMKFSDICSKTFYLPTLRK